MHWGIDSGSHEIAGREVLVSVDDTNGLTMGKSLLTSTREFSDI